jgi:hypothetical protein
MLHLTHKNLSVQTQDHLDTRQTDIDSKTPFDVKAERAGSLWDSKTGSQAGNAAFAEIKTTLISMCIGVEICNYCEQSEASDIEHILPKSLFPERTFRWTNYLLACKKCNTTHKLDSMYIFDPPNSANTIWVARGTEPASADYAFIQPRLENPMDCMQLSFKDFLFYARPPHAPGTRGFKKVERTLEILKLNNRPNLVKYRTEAFGNYKRLLREYVAAKNATTHLELENAVTGDPLVDHNTIFADEQQRIMDAIKNSIKTGEHVTVWREMIRQQNTLPNLIQQLFIQAPEALTW